MISHNSILLVSQPNPTSSIINTILHLVFSTKLFRIRIIMSARMETVSMPRRHRPSVSFDDNNDVVHSIERCIDDNSELWFTSEEYKHIRRRNKLVVQMARSGAFQETDQTTLLGLEKQTAAAKYQRKVARSHLLQRFSGTSRSQ